MPVTYLVACLACLIFSTTANPRLPKDCEGWREQWRRSQRLPEQKYLIDPDGNGGVEPFSVDCDMNTRPATTIIGHNYVGKMEVVLADSSPDSKIFTVRYTNVSMKQIEALMAAHGQCTQHLRYECHHSWVSENSHWWSRTGRKMLYFPGGPPTGTGCACGIDKSCDGGSSHLCNCDKNDATWRSDEGDVTNKTLLPITKMTFSDTDNEGERGFFVLSPLRCLSKQAVPADDFDVRFCEPATYRDRDFWLLPALHGSLWADDGFCVAISQSDPGTDGDYQLSVELMLLYSHSPHYGKIGIAFNLVDTVNYDLFFVAVNALDKTYCYEHGFVRNGRFSRTGHGECKHGTPQKHAWFSLKVEVHGSGLSTARLNNLFLADFKPHFPVRRLGGALTANELRVKVAFRNYQIAI